jgi:predicted metal-binding membrane protein
MHFSAQPLGQSVNYVYAAVLIVSGAYQFTSLKNKCLGYCESPMSFFMKRWSNGAAGAVKMGFYHGLYCLGCCWPYFLLMVALGWMNLFEMALFAVLIFGEKMWSKGIWLARIAGTGFILAGALVGIGFVQVEPMTGMESGSAGEMVMENAMDGMPSGETPPGDMSINDVSAMS